MSVTWELVRNAESQVPPGPAEIESAFHPSPQVILKLFKFLTYKAWGRRSH